jgi:hypothetical protein
MDPLLNALYTNVESSASFAGADRLYDAAHQLDPSVTRDEVRAYLEQNRTYTLHKPRRYRFKRLRTVPAGFFTDLQVDLADFQCAMCTLNFLNNDDVK